MIPQGMSNEKVHEIMLNYLFKNTDGLEIVREMIEAECREASPTPGVIDPVIFTINWLVKENERNRRRIGQLEKKLAKQA